ncbi:MULTISPECIES: K+/H+ antiporter subunit F [Tropicimonas]|uniref:Multisubunit potassium/proton antiporter, PhaF subunit n=2 Tax=Tropicimonas TaxID=599652 RepID=A0A239FI83_9RHOB|nr:K+/H+ antiporter subunit F [Tropicimonas sediminicola]SNS55902.1 multisubunit potassium/proton antiporter, PhaF subunit [Tropicimonas sediminicola]
MITFALYFAIACYGIGLLLNLWRIRFAPGVVDRILALDTMVINAIALLNIYGILVGTAVYFEVSLLIAMFGFVSTVAYCRFILRGNIIE